MQPPVERVALTLIWPARAMYDGESVVYADDPPHHAVCRAGCTPDTCGRRCACPCHDQPTPRRAA